MAIIPLRAYNHEIEGMIDNGQLDEAVAHCRHILTTFPKHIASYRLLGKAHLEQQRISDATDIFQRVLTAIPDDFIANVGMSIIREDENNLDAAIWHMELAYEAQPANIAIQDELRRLYGRRDGTQPPKVRLTRGALARMYAKGGLFDQSIAELHAAITEDPNRPDLQLLLAQMLYQTSQRVEAVETCVNILKKIPLCLEANRILAVSLPDAEGSDAVKNYRQIVISMDPYYAFAEKDAISSEQVPENAVNIEHLDWKSGIQIGETPNQPAWATSLGISMEKPAEENIPDWLKSAEAPPPGTPVEKGAPTVSPFIWDTQEVEKIITDTSKPEGDIPDWMKDAGWKTSAGEASTPTEGVKPEEPVENGAAGEAVEKTEIPDWLTGIAPDVAAGEEKLGVEPNADELSNPWLEPHQPGPTDSIIQWLDEKKPGTPATPADTEGDFSLGGGDEIPDWLKDIDLPTPTSAQEETAAGSTPAFSFESSALTEDAGIAGSAGADDTFLKDLMEPAAEIQPSVAQPIISPEFSETKEAAAAFEDEIPDWLKEIAEEVPAAGAFMPLAGEPGGNEAEITEAELTPEQPAVPEEVPVSQEAAVPAALFESTELLPETELTAMSDELASAEVEPIAEEVTTNELPIIEQALPEAQMTAVTEELPTAGIEPSSEEGPAVEPPVMEEALPEAEMTAVTEELPTAEPVTPSEELPLMEESVPTAEMTEVPEEISKTEFEPISTEGSSIGQTVLEEASSQEEIEDTKALPAVEQAVGIEQLQSAEAKFISDELPPIETTASGAEQPQVVQPSPLEGENASEEPASSTEPDAFAWLEGLVAEQGTMEGDLNAPLSEGEISPPDWVKLENEPTLLDGMNLEAEPEKAPSALPADEVPEWIKGLGEEPEIKPITEAPVPSDSPEAEIPQAEELPAWLLEMEPPEPAKEAPASPEEPLEWKSEELPDWLKEITESGEPEGAVPAMTAPAVEEVTAVEEIHSPAEVLPAEPIPAGLVEETTSQMEEIIPPSEAVVGAKAEATLEAGTWVPEVEAALQPVSETQPEVAPEVEPEAEPKAIPLTEELSVKAEQIPAISLPEPEQQPVETELDAEKEALANAREAITQGQPSEAVAFYSELIKQNYHLNEVIKDLQDALYRFPVDVDMWVTLGDAQNRSNELQEALNAYTKAEELVR